MPKAVRLKDIAQSLGISISTVSAALQNREDISETTRQRVHAAVQKLGYQPDSVARTLVTRRSNVLGVVVPDLSRSFFSELLKGVDSVVSEKGYSLLVCNTAENAEKEDQILGMLRSRRVDGLLIASAHNPRTRKWKQAFANLVAPIVFVDRRFPGLNFVGGDDEAIGLHATTHLAEQGYRRIAHISGPRTVTTAIGRRKGYLQALKNLSVTPVPALIVEANYHEESGGYEAMHELLRLPSPPDAVFAASDPIAIGAMQAALDSGLQLPTQLGLIGVGAHQYSRYLRVPLSTVEQQRIQIGQAAARMLLDFIDGANPVPPRHFLVEPRLVIRASSSRSQSLAPSSPSALLR
ncbi:MAG TPA: LacI family DNA-binding transcriptional regulator [Terrimicrobiaceae bacterium]